MTIIQLKTLRHHGLNLTATEALLTLANLGTTDMSGLAEQIAVSTASITKLVDRLEITLSCRRDANALR